MQLLSFLKIEVAYLKNWLERVDMIKSTIICDSIFKGNRITTYELEYPRFIHGEIMTHRVFSRNAMSSRAVPINKMMEQVSDNPAMPVQWGLNQSGMQAGSLHDDTALCNKVWQEAAQSAANSAQQLQDLGLHKQIVNRILEPFQLMKTIVTATEWDNFFELRTHKDAQPEFQVLAKLMKEQFDNNKPNELLKGEWHLPYIKFNRSANVQMFYDHTGQISEEDAIKISASCCAQVSYRVNDGSIDKALMIYDKLVNSKPIHASPFEHQGKATNKVDQGLEFIWGDVDWNGCSKGVTHVDLEGNFWSGNFKNWIQYRQLINGKNI